jgi:hypothetical protein
MTPVVVTVVGLILGSSVLNTIVTIAGNRRKTDAETRVHEADAATTIATNALSQVTSIQGRLDRAEGRIDQFQKALFPHQAWDAKAHKKALEVDPNFPPPPDLTL